MPPCPEWPSWAISYTDCKSNIDQDCIIFAWNKKYASVPWDTHMCAEMSTHVWYISNTPFKWKWYRPSPFVVTCYKWASASLYVYLRRSKEYPVVKCFLVGLLRLSPPPLPKPLFGSTHHDLTSSIHGLSDLDQCGQGLDRSSQELDKSGQELDLGGQEIDQGTKAKAWSQWVRAVYPAYCIFSQLRLLSVANSEQFYFSSILISTKDQKSKLTCSQ